MTTTIRLTNIARNAFVEACMCDVPKPDYDSLVKEAQDILYKLMSPPVRKVFRESPGALKYATVSSLADRGYAKLVVADVRFEDALEPIFYKAQARDRVRSTIRAIAYKCSTSKQLEEALPEFAHHVPKADKPTSNLPVPASFANDLKVLGFEPKVQKVEGRR